MKVFSTVLFSLLTVSLFAQGPIITPLKGNARLKDYNGQVSGKRAIKDTLGLQFFDDFTSTRVYPDMARWRDSQVFINSNFPISPPSFGVATFDNLNKKGAPYRALSGNTSGGSDSLTSNIINLKTDKRSNLAYTIADSIYLSFFYQTQGIGDPLDGTDSLVLKFKDTGGDWRTVWKAKGTSVKPFKQVLVGIKDSRFLSAGFQFRFINFGKNTGNMNQWHVDYIRMEKGRNMHDTVVEDLAINSVPVGPLRIYESMPYNHFKADASTNTLDFHSISHRNSYIGTINAFYLCYVFNKYDTLIKEYDTAGFDTEKLSDHMDTFFTPIQMDTFSGKEPIVRIKYRAWGGSNDEILTNNEYTKTVYFKNYYAYDDGSAEGGYGLDYGSLPPGPAYSALKFEMFKADTLGGISIFFNRSVSDVIFKPFTLIVWKVLSEPPANTTKNDVILKKIDMVTTRYSDSINGFINVILDTPLILPAGNFYIGWQQNSNFILNVGYDNNYKYLHQGGRNPNIFYNLNGYWERVSSTITGVPMIRPLFGGKLKDPSGIREQAAFKTNKVFIYPNPSGISSLLMVDSETDIRSVKVYDISGKLCLELSGENVQEINVANLSAGFYQVLVSDANNKASIHKYIKN